MMSFAMIRSAPKNSLFFAPLFLFVSCLVYDQYSHRSIHHQILLDENSQLEIFLEQIPVCTQFDRYRQRHILKTLIAWHQFATEHQIEYWLSYGSLVGYVQRRGLLPHDEDVDILIRANDTRLLVPFTKTNFSSTFKMKVHPDWSIVGYENRSYYREKGINFVAPNARFVYRLLHYHVDIWPMYEFDPENETLTDYGEDYDWSSTPRNWTFPLKRCEFDGIQTWCPAEPEKLVTKLYGESALNESDTRCVDGAWV